MNVQGLSQPAYQKYLQLSLIAEHKPDLLMFNETHLKQDAVFPSF